MVFYPDGVWCRPTAVADIDEIVDSHLRVDRLIMILSQG